MFWRHAETNSFETTNPFEMSLGSVECHWKNPTIENICKEIQYPTTMKYEGALGIIGIQLKSVWTLSGTFDESCRLQQEKDERLAQTALGFAGFLQGMAISTPGYQEGGANHIQGQILTAPEGTLRFRNFYTHGEAQYAITASVMKSYANKTFWSTKWLNTVIFQLHGSYNSGEEQKNGQSERRWFRKPFYQNNDPLVAIAEIRAETPIVERMFETIDHAIRNTEFHTEGRLSNPFGGQLYSKSILGGAIYVPVHMAVRR